MPSQWEKPVSSFAAPQTFGAAPTTDATCAAQGTLTPVPSTVFGCTINARRKAVSLTQGQSPAIAWTMVDQDGVAVNLSGCGTFTPGNAATGEIRLRVADSFVNAPTSNTPLVEVVGTVSDPNNGTVTFTLDKTQVNTPGIYLADAAVFSSAGTFIFSNQFYIVVNRGLWGTSLPAPAGPPSIAEIRLHLRDSDPSENSLMETLQWDLAEIALAIERPVLYWNESQPPINAVFTTLTFPFRFYWLEGVVSQLYLMAAHWYRRNSLPYSAGGIQVDDLNKAPEYEQIGQQKWAEYKAWVLNKKVGLNAESAMQSQASPYAQRGWW